MNKITGIEANHEFSKILTSAYLIDSSETMITDTPIINNENLYLKNL